MMRPGGKELEPTVCGRILCEVEKFLAAEPSVDRVVFRQLQEASESCIGKVSTD